MGCSGSVASFNVDGEIAFTLYHVSYSPWGDEIAYTYVYFFPAGISESSRMKLWKKVIYPDPDKPLEDYIVDYTVVAGTVDRVEKNIAHFSSRYAARKKSKITGTTRINSQWAPLDVASLDEDKVDLSICKRCCCCLDPSSCKHSPHYKNLVGGTVWNVLPREPYIVTVFSCIRVGDKFEITLNSMGGESSVLSVDSESSMKEVATAFHIDRGLRSDVEVRILDQVGKEFMPDDMIADAEMQQDLGESQVHPLVV